MPLIDKKTVLFLHSVALEKDGGMPGLRDAGLLDSALAQPDMTFDGQELFPTFMEKVAAIGHSLICNHPFVDGNKRVGLAVMLVVLKLNGVEFVCSEDEIVETTLRIAKGELSRKELAEWLDHNSSKIPDQD